MEAERPLRHATLSVVVTVVEAGSSLQQLLQALAAQQPPSAIDVVVPFDSTIAHLGALAEEFPHVTFLDLGTLRLEHDARTGAGQHELFDRRRAAGLRAATAPIVGMLEDRAIPGPDWAATMRRLHDALPHAVIGGPIATVAPDPLNFAFYACDFTRYAPPLTPGPREYVSDVNLSYKRRALEATRPVWTDIYNEVKVHWALVSAGEVLFLHDSPVVHHRSHYRRLMPLLRERVEWGRLFGAARAGHLSTAGRLAAVARAPLVPPLLWFRLVRAHATRGTLGRCLRATPAIVAMQVAWVAGETWGVVTGRT